MAYYPTETRCLVLTPPKSQNPKYPLDVALETRPIPELKEGEVLVRVAAAGFNRRELWQRQKLYPNTVPGTIIGADGAGRVMFAYDPEDGFLHRRVFFVPSRGWHSDSKGPEAKFSVLGGIPEGGTFSEFVVVHRNQIIPIPNHIPMVYAAAWPVGGVTAWRAVAIKANVKEGDNVLITGIGGGVAIIALQLCVAKGANVYVTSSNAEKIAHAKSIGAIDGVNYKEVDWPEKLGKILSSNARNGRPPLLDAVIDSAGGDICTNTNKIIRAGGIIVCYGMTVVPKIEFSMREVLKNIELKGSTMGSRQDLIDATAFIAEKHLVPEVSYVLRGLEEAHEGFRLLQEGNQMGKIVVKFPGREPDGEVRGSLPDSHIPNRM